MQIEVPVKLEDSGLTIEAWLPGEDDITQQTQQASVLPQGARPTIDRSISGNNINFCWLYVKNYLAFNMHYH